MASSSAAYDGNNGGAGGKFKKNISRKSNTTPYDRPFTALRPTQTLNNNNNNKNRWLSKIIDPASKLINSGANKLFSSVFRKRLLPKDEAKEIEYVQPENATNVVEYATNLPVTCGGNGCSGPSNSNGVTELEDILKQKTFTRSEIDQLTALILSRTTENSNGAENGMSESKLIDLQAVNSRRDKLSKLPVNENYIEHALSGDISTPRVRSNVLPDDVASPAEIAKAYMASTPSRLTEMSPSVLCLQNKLPKENLSTPYIPLSKSISPAIYLNQKAVDDIRNPSNGFMTPRFRRRSAVHSMARTPYSRVHPLTAFKAAETNFNIGDGSSYHNVTENNHYKKQVLKRRSSVLENDIGFVGSIRRVRQKPNFLHPKFSEVRSLVECSSRNGSFSNVPSVNSLPGTSSRYVPLRSIEMAQKIFEQLDKLSPNGNLKKQADASVENSPTLQCLPNSQDLKEPVHEHSHPTETLSMVSAKKFTSPSFSRSTQGGADNRNVVSYSSSKSKADRPMKKRAFQDYPKLDDDVPSNEVACSTPLTEGRHNDESPRKSVAILDILSQDQTIAVKKLPETKTTANMTISDAVSAPQSTLESANLAPQIEKSNIFTAFSSKSDNLPPFVCPPPSAAKDTKVELPVSANKVAAEVNSTDKTVNKSTPVFDNTDIKSGDPPCVQALPNGSQTNSTTLFNGGGQPTFTPSSFASNTTDISCDKSNATTTTVTTIGHLDAKPCPLSSGGNSIFSFTAPASKSTGCDVQSAGLTITDKPTFSFQAGSTPVSAPSFSDQFRLNGSSGLAPGSIFGSISANPFCSGPTTATSALGNTITSSLASTSSSATPSVFSFTSQSPKPTTAIAPTSPSPTFSFGLQSSGATSSSFVFGATANSSPASNNTQFVFGANSGLATSAPGMSNSPFPSQPGFSIGSSQSFPFGSTTPTNSGQITIEDTMAEDSPPGFGAQLSAPSGGFGFDAPPMASSLFQLNTQQSPIAPQNPLFQPSGTGDFNGGSGSFSLGKTDKSQRRIIRVKKGARGIKKRDP